MGKHVDSLEDVTQIVRSVAGGSGTGDMTKVIYDPNTIEADVFNMDNMTEGATSKILSTTERTNISANTTHRTSDGTDHTYIDQDVTSTADVNFKTLTTTGYIQGKKIGVFASLPAPDDTTITTAGTYYPIEGTFSNSLHHLLNTMAL